MGLWTDVVGTVRGYIRLGLTGVRLKNSSGALAVRNAGDSAYADVECGSIQLGHASDTTLTRASAGVVAVEGTNLVKAGAATSSGLTMATSRLLGRTTASTGAIEEITVGNGLSLSGGNLAVSGGVVQRVEGTPYTTYNSTSATIPTDDTIPQNTEGAEWATVTITPKNASNRLVIEAFFSIVTTGTVAATACFALFQDSTANALAATGATQTAGGYISNAYVKHEMAAGTTSATTFKVRAGASSGNLYVNGGTAARTYGGVASVRISVTEISA